MSMSILKAGQPTGRIRYRRAWYGRIVLQIEYWKLYSVSCDAGVKPVWRDVKTKEAGSFTHLDNNPEPFGILAKLFPMRPAKKGMDKEMRQEELDLLYQKAEAVIRTDLNGHNLAGDGSQCIQAMATQYSRFKNANQ